MVKIILVEENPNLTFFIKQYFGALGYLVESVNSGEKALKIIKQGFDIVLLDTDLPKMSGYTLLNLIRQENSQLPVIVISDKASEIYEIQSYERGADFFHRKPINYKILASQVKKLSSNSIPEKISFGDISITKDQKTLFINDTDIRLTQKELQFAMLLLKNQNKTFSKQELYEAIFDSDDFSRTRIDTFLSRFKSKIGKQFFESYYGMGIRFKSSTY